MLKRAAVGFVAALLGVAVGVAGPVVAGASTVGPSASPDLAAGGASGCPAAAYGANFYAPSLPGGGKTVALTFDDGPGPSTASILSILETYGVRATFFNIGQQE